MKRSRIDTDAVYARAGGMCEGLIAGVCDTRLQHYHHRKLRSRGGKDNTGNIAGLCAPCHDYVHRNVAAATGLGLIVSGFINDPATVPMYRLGHWALLTDDGMTVSHTKEA